MPASVLQPPDEGAWRTLRRGMALVPAFRRGLTLTLLLALAATAGRLVVPVAVQRVLDDGVLAPGGPDLRAVGVLIGAATVVLVLTSVASWRMTARLVARTEHALSELRVQAFRHLHDLSLLTTASEQRGALVGRVTADIDTISNFMGWGGVALLVSAGQIVLATAVMAFYDWRLTGVVLAVMVPLALVLRVARARLVSAYDLVRSRVGQMLGVLAESVVGAEVVRAYGVEDRTTERIDAAVDGHVAAGIGAARVAAVMVCSGEVFAAAATAAVVVVGVALRAGPCPTAALLEDCGAAVPPGELLAFLFLVALFLAPVQVATEVLNEAQAAVSGFRRVLAVLDTPTDIADPAAPLDLPPGPIGVAFDHVGFAYRPQTPVLTDVTVAIEARARIAVVGATGSGKTTFAKLLTRLLDPGTGTVALSGVPLDRIAFAQLRARVAFVPQDGFLFAGTIADNVRVAEPGATDAALAAVVVDLGLADWLAGLPDGLATQVGERGQALSAGERQLVALARAAVAEPDLLVLDEATSAVDPATEGRVQRALDGLARGRTAITIAHRLSTAEQADDVLVFDDGRLVQRGPHTRLVAQPGVYAALHADWSDQLAAG